LKDKLIVEFHCHTIYSDGLATPEKLLEISKRKGIDRLVITDHNTIRGALRARELDPERVIVGEEILTTQGEFLAAFVKEEIPKRLTPMETIRRLKDQGAFISVSHPFDRLRCGWETEQLLEILPYVDAIETFNARAYRAAVNQQAQEFAWQHHLAGTAGSDAHASFELGAATMTLPYFTDAASLRQAMAQVEYHTRYSGFWVHLVSRFGNWIKKMMPEQA
jgi:predicted metal-dependent phosphoesterase TrpH